MRNRCNRLRKLKRQAMRLKGFHCSCELLSEVVDTIRASSMREFKNLLRGIGLMTIIATHPLASTSNSETRSVSSGTFDSEKEEN